jgi:hypothetical protein
MGSPGYLVTCELFLNERLLLSYSPGGDTIAYPWFPHRFVRDSQVDLLKVTTETFMPSKRRAAVSKKATPWFVNLPIRTVNSAGGFFSRTRQIVGRCASSSGGDPHLFRSDRCHVGHKLGLAT